VELHLIFYTFMRQNYTVDINVSSKNEIAQLMKK